jgi:hypothetical protein
MEASWAFDNLESRPFGGNCIVISRPNVLITMISIFSHLIRSIMTLGVDNEHRINLANELVI